MIKVICIFLFIFQINSEKEKDLISCGSEQYQEKHGLCAKYENGTELLTCYDEYATYPEDSKEKCNYKRKRQLKAFLLELFVTYGSGHFYIGRYKYASAKLVVFVFFYCLFIVLRIVSKAKEENKKVNLAICIGAAICFAGMLAWQIVDLVNFGCNRYKDGHGVKLLKF